MNNFTRRTLLKGSTAAAAAGALTGSSLLEWAKAWAQSAPWKPEAGSKISILRWKYFVQAEDDKFVALAEAFKQATGVEVSISRESYEDVQPKASVAANTGTGPDLFWGLYSLPHLFPDKGRGYDGRCRLPRQEIRAVGRQRGEIRQGRQQVGRHSDLLQPAASSTTASARCRRRASRNFRKRPTNSSPIPRR